MMRRVLYPTDFSKASELGISVLEELRQIGVEEVFLIHVIDLNRLIGPVSGIDIPAVLHDYEDETRQNLEKFGEKVEELGFRVKVLEPRAGEPSAVISEVAQEVGADMVTIPSHGKGLIAGMLLGSVSEGVVKRSRVPVLVIKFVVGKEGEIVRSFDRLFSRILLAYDFSESSEELVKYVKEFAVRGKADEVLLVHVIEKGNELPESRLKRLEEIEREFESSGVDVEIFIEAGTPYKEIVRVAEEKLASLVAVSATGSGLLRSLLGGTADGVVRRSKVPVFVCRRG
ncbi:MAG: universal stress protein [Archaeoglobi archaeon]|nr:universal stress protein [Archaeoglobi archaeon]